MTRPVIHIDSESYIQHHFAAILHHPPLLGGHPFVADASWLAHFRQRARLPRHSHYHGSRRLGFYYQWLWRELIIHHPDYHLIAEEIQVSEEGRTIGAVDFLVKNRVANTLEHWEVAIKFYLAHQGRWPGPNARDELDKKSARMLEHQLPLSGHSTISTKYGQINTRRLIMQGRLFYPAFDYGKGSGIITNPAAPHGKWCYAEQIPALELRPISKFDWLAPPDFNTLAPCPASELRAVGRPRMAVAPDQSVWFIMPGSWPNYR